MPPTCANAPYPARRSATANGSPNSPWPVRRRLSSACPTCGDRNAGGAGHPCRPSRGSNDESASTMKTAAHDTQLGGPISHSRVSREGSHNWTNQEGEEEGLWTRPAEHENRRAKTTTTTRRRLRRHNWQRAKCKKGGSEETRTPAHAQTRSPSLTTQPPDQPRRPTNPMGPRNVAWPLSNNKRGPKPPSLIRYPCCLRPCNLRWQRRCSGLARRTAMRKIRRSGDAQQSRQFKHDLT